MKNCGSKRVWKKEILERTQPSLDDYLRDDLEPEVIFVDDDILKNEINNTLQQN